MSKTVEVESIVDIGLLNDMIISGYIRERNHPKFPYTLYHYTQKAQYERKWNEATLLCRGLILDDRGHVIARPFKKFFNYEEIVSGASPYPVDILRQLFSGKFWVTPKHDGSMIIAYPNPSTGKPEFCTKGSFDSAQALEAAKIRENDMGEGFMDDDWFMDFFSEGITPIYEVIYPENRIVLDYGNLRSLIPLGEVNNRTGVEHPIFDGDPLQAESQDEKGERVYANLRDHLNPDGRKAEGYVLSFWKGNPLYKIKIKSPAYVALHRSVFGMTERRVWEALKEGKEDEYTNHFDEEVREYARRVVDELQAKYLGIEMKAMSEYIEIRNSVPELDRKSFALRAKDSSLSALLFGAYDKKDCSGLIWRMIEPTGNKALKFLEDDGI